MKTADCFTKKFAVVGHPVKHSHSPKLFNTIFLHQKINAVYLAFEYKNMAELVKSMRALKWDGYSVTIPHKEKAFDLVDEVDALAKETKAINTIVQRDKKLYGYNFDGIAAVQDLAEKVENWDQRPVLFLGAGGAARGIALAMAVHFSFSQQITLAVRTPKKAEDLAETLDKYACSVKIVSLKEIKMKKYEHEIVVQTTPVGMKNQQQISLMESDNFSKESVAYDIIYNPNETHFLKQAKMAGAQTINGLGMFLGQARLQLHSFVGLELSCDQMHEYYKKSQAVD